MTLNRIRKDGWHYVRPITGRRISLAIIKQFRKDNGKVGTETIKDPRVDIINARMKSLEITKIKAHELVQEICDSLNKEADASKHSNIVISCEDNRKILQKIWDEDYKFRDIVSKRSRMGEFANIFHLLGHKSILTIDWKTFQKLVNDAAGPDREKQRRMAGAANQIIKFLKSHAISASNLRELKKLSKGDSGPIHHLTEQEMKKVLAVIQDKDLQALYAVAWATGGRLGEVLNITEASVESIEEDSVAINIEGQILKQETDSDAAPTKYQSKIIRKNTLKTTKSSRSHSKNRPILMLKLGHEYLSHWISLSYERRVEIRKMNYNRPLLQACALLFPDAPTKQCSMHDLRHSYAIYLLTVLSCSIQEVAWSLGDSVKTTENHYVGFIHTKESLEKLKEKFVRRQKTETPAPPQESSQKNDSLYTPVGPSSRDLRFLF